MNGITSSFPKETDHHPGGGDVLEGVLRMSSDFSSVAASRDFVPEAVPTLDLISLHVPKAFGTSIGAVIARHYGERRVAADYENSLEDGPPTEPPKLEPTVVAVHGHFPAVRYAGIPARRRVAFLREPIRRTISHYFFWLVEPRHGNRVHDKMLDERLGLLEFARLPAIQRFYSHTVFGGCNMASFDLVGVVEDLTRDWPRFQRLTGIFEPLPHVNRNRYPGYEDIVAAVTGDSMMMRELAGILAEDILFYARFL